MVPMLWCIARRSRMGFAPISFYNYHNLKFNAKSTFSTQKNVIDSHQLQYVNVDQTQSRQLYTRNALGLEKLELQRKYVSERFKDVKDEYIERLTRYVYWEGSDRVLLEDFTNLIGLADCEKHLDLIERIAINFVLDPNFSVSGWGTAVMRLYYTMNQSDRANKNLRDIANFGQFFNKKSCYRIAMTMLFNAGRYRDVIEIYHLACKRLEPLDSLQPDISVLAFGAYAKINTLEALNDAKKLYDELDYRLFGSFRMRVLSFLIYLYVNQGQFETALNMISSFPFKNYHTMRELKTIALMKMGLYDDLIRHILESLDNSERGRILMRKDVYEMVQSHLVDIKNDKVHQRLRDILIELEQADLVGHNTLDSMLYAVIDIQQDKELEDRPSRTTAQLIDQQRRLRMKAQIPKVP